MSSRTRSHVLAALATRIDRAADVTGDERLAQAAADLAACQPDALAAFQRMQDARASSLGAASYDGPMVTGGGSSSSTERLALTADRTASDRLRCDVLLQRLTLLSRFPKPNAGRIANDARLLWQLVAAWTPKAATAKDQREVQRRNDATPECAHTRATVGTFEPVHRTSDFGCLLPSAMPVCLWVYKFTKAHGRLPTQPEMDRHHQGRRVYVSAD